MDAEIAQDLGARFVLRSPVGSGGMATVYRALDRHTGDTVAVKLLHAGDPSHLARFALEVGALASLGPSVAPVRSARGARARPRARLRCSFDDPTRA